MNTRNEVFLGLLKPTTMSGANERKPLHEEASVLRLTPVFNALFSRLLLGVQLVFQLIVPLGLLTACAVNPVTGRNELSLVSETQERQIGAEQYGPSQQSQGGQYEVDAELTAYVSQVGQRLAAVSDRKLDYEFVVLNNGVPNAWALPGGKIAVNRGLLYELTSEAELAAVLGHEITHAAARHGAQAMTKGTLLQGALAVGAIAVGTSDYRQYGDYILGGAQLGAQLITQSNGRDAEREADYYGIQYMVRAGYDPQAAISLQQTFVRLSAGQKSSWMEGMFASHPPSQERVQNNQKLVAELMPTLAGRDLEVGEQRYQQAMAKLQKTKPAYDLFDEAEKAVKDDDLEIALGNVDEAIKMVPNEARFHGLKGDLMVYQHRYRDAVKSYDDALAQDSNYFDYYLGRGVAHSRLKESALARTDLEQSAKLLPTAIAMNELGKIALTDGDRTNAKRYFQQASQAQGILGKEAATAFITLDIQDNPSNYLQAQAYVDQAGRVVVRVTNQSPVQLNNIEVEVAALINSEVRRTRVAVRGVAASSYQDVVSGLGYGKGAVWTPDMVSAQVVGAGL
jgi:beta-barrel assembly-enhancing protease